MAGPRGIAAAAALLAAAALAAACDLGRRNAASARAGLAFQGLVGGIGAGAPADLAGGPAEPGLSDLDSGMGMPASVLPALSP